MNSKTKFSRALASNLSRAKAQQSFYLDSALDETLYSMSQALSIEEKWNWARFTLWRYKACWILYIITTYAMVFALIYGVGTVEIEVAIRESSAASGFIAIMILALLLICNLWVNVTIPAKLLGNNNLQKQRASRRIWDKAMGSFLNHTARFWNVICGFAYIHLLPVCIILAALMCGLCGFLLRQSYVMRMKELLTPNSVLSLSVITVLCTLLMEVPCLAMRVGLKIEAEVADEAEVILMKIEE